MQGRRSLVAALVGMVMVLMLVSASSVLAGGGGNSLNAKSCYKLGWKGLVTPTGATFASQDACVSYAAKGGVLKRPQTVSFTSTNPSPVTVGGTYTPTATATSGLSVTFTTSGGCTLASHVVTFTAPGTCVIDANQAGNATYNAAAQVQQSITVQPTCAGSENFSADALNSQPTAFAGGTIEGPYGIGGGILATNGSVAFPAGTDVLISGFSADAFRLTFINAVSSLQLDAFGNTFSGSTVTLTAYDSADHVVGVPDSFTDPGSDPIEVGPLTAASASRNIKYFTIQATTGDGVGFTNISWGCA